MRKGKYKFRTVRSNPKLVLLDIRMPKVGGLEVIERVRKNPSTCSIPIVVLTTSQEDSDKSQAYKFGVNSYIVKPFKFENFSKCVRDLGDYWLALNEAPVK